MGDVSQRCPLSNQVRDRFVEERLGMEVVATRTDDMDPHQYERMISCLSADRQLKVRRLRRDDDRIRSLTGEVLIRVYGRELWGIRSSDLILRKNEYHKPYIDNYPMCQFNLSHSGSWVVAVFHNVPVGIDVEQISPIDISLADRIFAEEEIKQLCQQATEGKLRYFFQLWTLKESYVKAKGMGLSIPLNSFHFHLTDERIRFQSTIDTHAWQFRRYCVDAAYELAVCNYGAVADFPDAVRLISQKELFARFEMLMSPDCFDGRSPNS